MIQLAAEITAWFTDIDEAELAARQLRQRGHGISSLRIRQPRPKETDSGVPRPISYYETAAGQTWMTGGNMSGMPAFFPGIFDERDAAAGGQDGPAGRSDCLMVIRTGERHAEHNAAILTSLHAQNLHVVTGLP